MIYLLVGVAYGYIIPLEVPGFCSFLMWGLDWIPGGRREFWFVGEPGLSFREIILLGDGCEILINNQPRVWQEMPLCVCCVGECGVVKRKSMTGGGF